MKSRTYDYHGNVYEIINVEYRNGCLQALINDVNCVDSAMWVKWTEFCENSSPID